MDFLLHMLSHAVLDRHKKNMEKMRDRLHDHHVNHDEEKKKQKRAILLQQQLHQAMKVHLFRKDLTVNLVRVSQEQSRQRAQVLIGKLSHIEGQEKKLAAELHKKTQLHAALTARISQLEKEVDDVLCSVRKKK